MGRGLVRSVCVVVALGFLLSSCGGYGVDSLDGEVNTRASSLSIGDVFTFADVFGVACSEVRIVRAYASDVERDALVGKAEVSMRGQGSFVLTVAFDLAGERHAASRLARVPVDFDHLGGETVDCSASIFVDEGPAGDGVPRRGSAQAD